MTNRMTLRMGFVLCAAFGVLAGPLAVANVDEDAPTIRALRTARQRGSMIVELVIDRPADMSRMTIERQPYQVRHVRWPRMAQVSGAPAWDYPAYLDFEREARFGAVTIGDQLTFLMRCAIADKASVTLRYPVGRDAWREIPLELDLEHAEAMQSDPPPLTRWAAAQLHYFEVMSDVSGDVGGFWSFAQQQSRRQFSLEGKTERLRSMTRGRRFANRMYAVTTGALAIQESMQLDRMSEASTESGTRTIPIEQIRGVQVKSHPFNQMREGKKPVHSELAALVPEDQYYVRFANVARFLELLDFSEQWGPSLLRLASPVGADYGVRARTLRQLCLTDDILARMLGPKIIRDFALTGSDPYLRQGSDVSVLFRVADKGAFSAALDLIFNQARRAHADAEYGSVDYKNVTIERLVGPRRRVSCYRAWLGEVCVYSNSLVAMRRIIDAHAGSRPNLASAAGFQYMRAAVFPASTDSEDGFLYLSDPFIRRLVGPELRIKQRRRLQALTSLKLLTNAMMYYGYQHGPAQPNVEDLVHDGSLTSGDLFDPEGGSFTWDSADARARSSVWGSLEFLTPLVEIDARLVNEKERDEYDRFRTQYTAYWRQYFDPIGMRIKLDKTISLETCILPLIDSSAYDQFEDTSGGKPISVRLDRFTPETLLRFVIKLDDGVLRTQVLTLVGGMTNATTNWVGDWATFWVEDTAAFNDLVKFAYADRDSDDPDVNERAEREMLNIFNSSFVFGVSQRNKLSLAAFLVSLRGVIQTTAPNLVIFNNLQPYKNVTIVQLAPDPSGEIAQDLDLKRNADPTPEQRPFGVDERGPALYYATIEGGFYVSTQAAALRRLIDRIEATSQPSGSDAARRANVMIYANPAAAERVRPAVSYLLEQRTRQVSLQNLAQVWLLGRCGLLTDRDLTAASSSFLGYQLVCPNGGDYSFDPSAMQAASSVYGSMREPKRLDALPDGSPMRTLVDSLRTLTASLQFTDDGLSTRVELERRSLRPPPGP